MKQSEIRGCLHALRPSRITLRSIRATSWPARMGIAGSSPAMTRWWCRCPTPHRHANQVRV